MIVEFGGIFYPAGMPNETPPGLSADRWFNVDGNDLKLVHEAEDRLQAVLELISQARHSLKLCFYMFEDDKIGIRILSALVAACGRKVSVELIVDSFGSNGTRLSFFDPLTEAGGRFSVFSPSFSTSYFVRNHQKMIIADDCRAIIGGFNIANHYFDAHDNDSDKQDNPNSWEDLGVVIRGPEILRLSDYYTRLSDWVNYDNGNVRALMRMVRKWDSGKDRFRWLLGGPSNRLSRWAMAIKKDLETGKQLNLVTAYFSPGQGLLRRIGRISKQGGKSRLVLAGKTDNGATIGASRLLYGYLLKRNARIFEYQPKRLHTKLVIVDNAVYIGSANFDLRSLFINVEMMLRIDDEAFANHARQLAQEMAVNSLSVTPELHQGRKGILNRIRWTLSYFFVNTLDYTVTRRLNFGVKK